MILGGTFAVLAVAGGSAGGGQIQQIGYGVALGVLMDTFLLRSLLVPSLVVLLGRWNWLPSHLAREAGPISPTAPGTDAGPAPEGHAAS
jgi:RND superfamily putative drug exporter